MQRHKQLTRTTTLHRAGPRLKAWDRVRRQLKVEFEKRGIMTCELGLPGCQFDNNLSFAHRMKRRYITTEQELRVVILACVPCHSTIELQSHATMKNIVDNVIASRETL